jgi:hypothetical protein
MDSNSATKHCHSDPRPEPMTSKRGGGPMKEDMNSARGSLKKKWLRKDKEEQP